MKREEPLKCGKAINFLVICLDCTVTVEMSRIEWIAHQSKTFPSIHSHFQRILLIAETKMTEHFVNQNIYLILFPEKNSLRCWYDNIAALIISLIDVMITHKNIISVTAVKYGLI